MIDRATLWSRLKAKYDVIVVGGGITGAGITRDCALRGLKVALFEKNDFAWGTSSRSSKLVHGGFRYLEHYEFGLVMESLRERLTLMRIAPHNVHPLPFCFQRRKTPFYSATSWSYCLRISFFW